MKIRNLKKWASLVLAAVLAVTAMTGCGENSDDPNFVRPNADGYAEGHIGNIMHTEFFDFTVNSAYTCPTYENYIPDEGHQLVIVDLTISNTFSETIPMFDTDFMIQWSDEADDACAYPITYVLESGKTVGQNMLPGQYDLAKKETRTGIVAYEVPAGESQFSLGYLTMFEDESYGNIFFVFFTANEK